MPPRDRCRYYTCDRAAYGLVRIAKVVDANDNIRPLELPCCKICADHIAIAVDRHMELHTTPDGNLYVGPLERYIPRQDGRPR